MAITNETVLKKMMNEIQEAMLKSGQTGSVREHVRAVRLLCDLVLDERPDKTGDINSSARPSAAEVQEPSAAEIRKMMGDTSASKQTVSEEKKRTNDHDEANGDSIFDF